MKNYTYFLIYLFSYFASIFMFDYLAWKRKHLQQFVDLYCFEISNVDLLALKGTPLPSRSCVLPDTVCKCVSADMFLVSITLWSPVEVILCRLPIIAKLRRVTSEVISALL
jgi:hypothetical protein